MSEHMGAVVEVWPVAADATGIWLLSGADAWRSERIPADDEPHSMLDYTLWANGAKYPKFAHSTSWRVDGPHIVLTYITVIDVDPEEPVKDSWPDALPISAELAEAVGPAGAGEALQPPVPRHIDVLLHGIRHLRFLLDTDSTARESLADPWPRHLDGLQPALAGMYSGDTDEPVSLTS